MTYLRRIAMLAAEHDIVVDSRWISTTENWLADLLSRAHFDKLANTDPQLLVLQNSEMELETRPKAGIAKPPYNALPPDISGGG